MSRSSPDRTASPRVFTIASGTPFLATFARAFRSGRLFDRDTPLSPEEMASARIFVPTRRAAMALSTVLANMSGSQAVLLPRILPLGDGEALGDDGLALLSGAHTRDIPPVVSDFNRRLALFRMVDVWRRHVSALRDESGEREPFHVAATATDAFALAGDLARLIDETIIEDVPLAALAGALPEAYDPEQHDRYWTLTQRFLQIAAATWPDLLAEAGKIDRADALKMRFRALAATLSVAPPSAPVVIAGSTGSVAATADLMAVVARLSKGAVVLPGLDLVSEDRVWDLFGHPESDLPTRFAHPQVILKRTLVRIGLPRSDVRRLGSQETRSGRERLAAELFRPAATTDEWKDRPAEPEAFDGISLVTASDEREEALAIALALRETLEHSGATAALVTPDRTLARMVRGELARWGIRAADSAGEPLATTPAGVLARLALSAARPDAGASDLLALLRHADTTLVADAAHIELVDVLDVAVLRGKGIKGGVDGLVRGIMAAGHDTPSVRDPAPRRRIPAERLARALELAEAFRAALAPLTACLSGGSSPLRQMAAAHRQSLAALTSHLPDAGLRPDRMALMALFDAMLAEAEGGPHVSLQDYAGMFDQLAAEVSVPSGEAAHPRLKIWGLLEARLLEADRIVLGGLDDGLWPPEARGDAFLNRPMRIALGLQPPERRIGQTAHDFMMLLGGKDVILTRASKRGGSPTVASRFLRRLLAYASEDQAAALSAAGQPYLLWARALDAPRHVTPATQPSPRIPSHLMPPRLSLTEIETLYRDPYAVFARRVLGLDPLDPLDPAPDARDRGTAIHDALAAYSAATINGVPEEAEALLLSLGQSAFEKVAAGEAVATAFWWHRFTAFVPWFVTWDRNRRAQIRRLHCEISGRLDLPLPGGQIRLDTRADRIEELDGGGYAIIDYKTGTPPSSTVVLAGLAPQLPLTAALLARGAFPGLGGNSAAHDVSLAYLAVAKTGGEGKLSAITSKTEPLDTVIDHQMTALQAHLGEYLAGARGFTSRRMPQKTRFAGDFDHLARVREWSLGGEGEDMDGAEE